MNKYSLNTNRKKYFKIGMGGTFDHFHAGHAKFLSFASELGAHLMIGVTDPHLTRGKSYEHLIESYSVRAKAVHHYCNQHHIAHTIVRLNDPYGPTLEGSEVTALVVTPETSPGADKINELRSKLQLRALPVYICDYFLAEDGNPLHAEKIRAGIANRNGEIYSRIFNANLSLDDEQRIFFQKPQGPIIIEPGSTIDPTLKIVVGDMSLRTFIREGWQYDLGIYDRQEQRKNSIENETLDLIPNETVSNPPGVFSLQLIKVLEKALKQKTKHILVEGEEDLAAVAMVLLAPLNTQIYYGQPGEGIVEMIANESLKNTFYQVLTKPNLSQN